MHLGVKQRQVLPAKIRSLPKRNYITILARSTKRSTTGKVKSDNLLLS